jgi:hypothetical protein
MSLSLEAVLAEEPALEAVAVEAAAFYINQRKSLPKDRML